MSGAQINKGPMDLMPFGSFGRDYRTQGKGHPGGPQCPKCGKVFSGLGPNDHWCTGCELNPNEHIHVTCWACQYEILTYTYDGDPRNRRDGTP